MTATAIGKILKDQSDKTVPARPRMPVLFVGHGSPLTALGQNPVTASLSGLGRRLPRPTAIVVVSAHWITPGTKILKSEKPETIHDFFGFPQELYQIRYPAPGAVDVAEKVREMLMRHEAALDANWGLDHGAWTMLHHLYPQADIPVLQLSLNGNLDMRAHFKLAQDLKPLRDLGVLLMGSGNVTHNLRDLHFHATKPVDWALEFDDLIKNALLNRDTTQLWAQDASKLTLWKKAFPTLEHYLPLLYIAGAADESETPTFPYEGFDLGTLSMRSVLYGA